MKHKVKRIIRALALCAGICLSMWSRNVHADTGDGLTEVFNEIGHYVLNGTGSGMTDTYVGVRVNNSQGWTRQSAYECMTHNGQPKYEVGFSQSSTVNAASNLYLFGNSSSASLESDIRNYKETASDKIKKAYLVISGTIYGGNKSTFSEFAKSNCKLELPDGSILTPKGLQSADGKTTDPAYTLDFGNTASGMLNSHAGYGTRWDGAAYADITAVLQYMYEKNTYTGNYTCYNVPCTPIKDGTDNYCTWKLVVVEEQMNQPVRNCILKLGGCSFGGEDQKIELDVLPKTGVKTRYTACDGQFVLGIDGGDISSGSGNHVEYSTSKKTTWQPVPFKNHRFSCSNCSGNSITGEKSPLTRCFEKNGILMNPDTCLDDSSYETDFKIDGKYLHTCWGSDYIITNFSNLGMYEMNVKNLSSGVLNNAEWMKLRLWTYNCYALCNVLGSCVDIDLPETEMSAWTYVQPLDSDMSAFNDTQCTKYPVLRTKLNFKVSSPTMLGSDMKAHYILNPDLPSGYGHSSSSSKGRIFSVDFSCDSWDMASKSVMVYRGTYSELRDEYKGSLEQLCQKTIIICLNNPDGYAGLGNLPENLRTDHGFRYSFSNTNNFTASGKANGSMQCSWDIITAYDFNQDLNTVKISASMSGNIISQGTYTGRQASNVASATTVTLVQKDTAEYYDHIGVLTGTDTYYMGIKDKPKDTHAGMSITIRPALSLAGYRFDGWKEQSVGKLYAAETSYTTTAYKTRFDASMTKVRYAITLNDNGGTGGSGTIYEWYGTGFYSDKNLTKKITKVNVPTKTGYDFLGYFGTGTKADIPSSGSLSGVSNSKYESDTTLDAKWALKKYTITYHSNYHASGMTEIQKEETKHYFTPLPIIAPEFDGKTLAKKDYHFLGWSTDSKATVPEYYPGDNFTTNANTHLYAVWEEDILEADIGAEDEDNPGCYHDPLLDNEESDGVWYRDSVVVKGTGFCNYAPVANVSLCEPLTTEDEKEGNFIYNGPDGQDWYTREYMPVDMDGDAVTDDAVRLMSRVTISVANPPKKSEIKSFYIDTECPEVYSFCRVYDMISQTYTISMFGSDEQSGVAEAALQVMDAAGSWSDIKLQDFRTYGREQSGYYTTEHENATIEFSSLPVNTSAYDTLYRIACRDGVGHESYSKTFTLAEELKLHSSIRKINGTSAAAGEELELLQYGDMRTWADVKTKGYAEQLLYVIPDCIHMSEGSHTQLTDPAQLDALPLEDAVRENYKENFDKYNFYIIDAVNDAEGKASDTFAMECEEERLELKQVYNVYVYALRGEDCKRNILKIKYLHKMLAHRVIISQSWQKPVMHLDGWLGKLVKEMQKADKKDE